MSPWRPGGASGFFGIGGGFLIVPGLILASGMSTVDAVGTSLLAVGAFGLVTAINYAAVGWVDWVLAVEVIVGGIAAGWAARLSQRVSARGRTFSTGYSRA